MSEVRFRYNHKEHTIDKTIDGLTVASYKIRKASNGDQIATVTYNGKTTTINRVRVQAGEQGLIPPEEVISNKRGRGKYRIKWIHTDEFNNVMPYVFEGDKLIGMVDYNFNPYAEETHV